MLEATIEQNAGGQNDLYQNRNITCVENFVSDIINYRTSTKYETFRITIRAK